MATAAGAERSFDYGQTLDTVLLALRQFAMVASFIPAEDIAAALEAVGRAEAFGFVVDPTAYRRALTSGSLERQRAVLQLFVRTQAQLQELFPDDAIEREMAMRVDARVAGGS